jgi:hypothetical protein
MKVALGLKAHSGWAALVVIGTTREGFHVVDRRRIELIEEGETWARMPYHAAEEGEAAQAQDVVKRGRDSAHRVAARQVRDIVAQSRLRGDDIVGCAVLMPEPMPDWSTEQILAVHFRMHKAEGVLFPDALCRAAEGCELKLVTVPEKQLDAIAQKALAAPIAKVMQAVSTLGKGAGAPWGKDQKTATIAALIALRARIP